MQKRIKLSIFIQNLAKNLNLDILPESFGKILPLPLLPYSISELLLIELFNLYHKIFLLAGKVLQHFTNNFFVHFYG